MIGFAAVVLSTVLFTLLSGWLAGRRGRSARLWYWLGAIFGPFAALAIVLLPPASDRRMAAGEDFRHGPRRLHSVDPALW